MKGVDLLPIYVQDVPVTTPGLDVPKRLEIDDALYERATNQCPTYLSTTGFINLILDQGLAGGARLIEPSRDRQPDERGEGSISTSSSITSNSSINTSIKQHKKGSKSLSKHTKGSPEFETFWTAYQSSPLKANGQSKAKAWETYKDVIKHVEPDSLVKAVQNATADITRRQGAGEFAAPLPDCFRWLRDEHYAVWLETHQQVESKPSYFVY